ncbi:protein angel homolog 1-like isoform X1 [Hemitrygon akajei]|uniref:protein angel homolog 1-like isoform X1 n=1 Tax=Hemitrygon akajei TaxID=2704970 RepID=UPI003BF9EDAC
MVGSLLCYVLAPLATFLSWITGPRIDDDIEEECPEDSCLETDEVSGSGSTSWFPLSKDQSVLLQDWLGVPSAISRGVSEEEKGTSVDADQVPQQSLTEILESEEAAMTWQQARSRPTVGPQLDPCQVAADQGNTEAQRTSTPDTSVSSLPQGEKKETSGWMPASPQSADRVPRSPPTRWQFQPQQYDHQNVGTTDWQLMASHSMSQPAGSQIWHLSTALGVNEAAANTLWQFQNEGDLLMNIGQLSRTWEPLKRQRVDEASKGGLFEFTIMSYNILSQDLLETNKDLYSHCQPEFLTWEFRFQNIMEEFESWDADIMCLQEVQENHYYQQFRPALQLRGYDCIYKRRTGIKTDGCAVCFKRDRFSLISEHPVEYFRPIVETLNRDNVALLALLRPLTPGSSQDASKLPDICVANTHLIFNPRRGDIKLTQLAVLFAEIQQVVQAAQGDGTPCPVILCGDLNSVPDSPLYKLICNGELYYYGIPTWKVSCQEDYSNQFCPRKLYGPLWPSRLRITDNCQYVAVCEKKTTGIRRYGREFLLQFRFSTPALVRPEHLDFIEGVTDAKPEPPGDGSERYVRVSDPEDELFCKRSPTTIRHNLNLTSVYTHFQSDTGRPEVTTCSSGFGLTVDYIFYSAQPVADTSRKGHRRYQDGPLKLLGRLSLLSEHDVWLANGLPNAICSSDHLSLLAKFGLKPHG